MHKRRSQKPDGRQLMPLRPSPHSRGAAPRPAPSAPPTSRTATCAGTRCAESGSRTPSHRQNRTFLPPPEYNPLAPPPIPTSPTEVPAGDVGRRRVREPVPDALATAHDPPEIEVPTRPGRGACEVVVFTQDPRASLGGLPLDHLELLAEVWADRYRELGGARRRAVRVRVREPRRRGRGDALASARADLRLPVRAAHPGPRAGTAGRRTSREHGRGLLEDVVARETADGRRVIYGGDRVVAFIPVFARYSYEVWIAPRRPVPLHRRPSTGRSGAISRAP